ncbi:hypothetical protein [Mycobacterium paraense]|uniref:hypothetical protein n=1 Tax=Mycobacterium paraense TaxID=767916 RepID=UPI00114DF5B8|nr:hypothetical protein [Mycobacterium paraense]
MRFQTTDNHTQLLTLNVPMIHRFCITHKTPLLPQSWYDDCIALGDFQTDSALHVKQLDRFWHEARPLAYSSAGTCVLPIAIKRFCSAADRIEISSYRKRILPSPEGVESQIYPTMRELSPISGGQAEVAILARTTDLEFLVSQPLYFKQSIIGQYEEAHHRRDILDYTSLAIETGVLDSKSAWEFLDAKHFIPGGVEQGIYPRAWLVDALSKIERVGRLFLERHSRRLVKYDDYQIRAVGFLSERLGSYFLLRHFNEKYSNNIPNEIFGYMSVVVDNNSGYSAGLTDRPANRPRSYPLKVKRAP